MRKMSAVVRASMEAAAWLTAAATILALAANVLAQAQPATSPMTLIIPFPPGSESGQLGRVKAVSMFNALGRPASTSFNEE